MVEKSASVYFKKCIFTQKTPLEQLLTKLDLIPVASVAGWNPKSPAQITLIYSGRTSSSRSVCSSYVRRR